MWEQAGSGFCDQCKQSTEQFDKDLLPDKQEKLKWRTWKACPQEPDDPPGGRWAPGGSECYFCWDSRRRYYGCSLAEMKEKRTQDPAVDEDYHNKRRKRARGEDKHERKTSAKKYTTSSAHQQYDDNFVEGSFKPLHVFLVQDMQMSPAQVQGLSVDMQIAKVSAAGYKPVKGKFGSWGVEIWDSGFWRVPNQERHEGHHQRPTM